MESGEEGGQTKHRKAAARHFDRSNARAHSQAMYDNGDLDRIVISPGPGHPTTDSGISRDVIRWGMGKVPILGVCMGLECVVDVFGGDVSNVSPVLRSR